MGNHSFANSKQGFKENSLINKYMAYINILLKTNGRKLINKKLEVFKHDHQCKIKNRIKIFAYGADHLGENDLFREI